MNHLRVLEDPVGNHRKKKHFLSVFQCISLDTGTFLFSLVSQSSLCVSETLMLHRGRCVLRYYSMIDNVVKARIIKFADNVVRFCDEMVSVGVCEHPVMSFL